MTTEDKKILIELICTEQSKMIVTDHTLYCSDRYKRLEELKVEVKDLK